MPIRIFLNGSQGRMGQVIRQIISQSDDLVMVAGSDLVTDADVPYPIYDQPIACTVDFDVVIDFSNPSALPGLFELIRQRRCPAVICTTGLSTDLETDLAQLAQIAPIFKSANMSLGINLLAKLARQAAHLLVPDYDIEIIEAHHNQKVDAPSGTALMLAEQINQELNGKMQLIHDRSQIHQKRNPIEIGMHAIRGGNIVGEHTVLFAGQEELITLHHSAGSRSVFARGAIAAARFIVGKPAGLYDMNNLLET
ncbi:MAG: 4-hydroxy-tetrahydrodipicolinate reductase [Clostridiaceae bacterium]|nr:4-hydroxy-tetrahydrodipicolinate reductase [Clostridiaceae bacterium]